MVFWKQNCSDLLREKMFYLVIKKKFEIRGLRSQFCKKDLIISTIDSNSDSSVQFFKQNAFLRVPGKQFKLQKIVGISKHACQVRK